MDYAPYYEETSKHLSGALGFLQDYGIGEETAKALNLGYYDPETMPDLHRILIEGQGNDNITGPTLIIPFNEHFWIGIDLESKMRRIPPVDPEARRAILGWNDLFTLARPIWLAHTPLDWLALKSIGANSAYIDAFGESEFIRILMEKPPSEAIICIPPDSNEATRGSCEGMAEKIRDAGIPATVPQFPEGWPGLLEMLKEDPGGLQAYVEDTESRTVEGRTAEHQRYEDESAKGMISGFMAQIYAVDPSDAIPTGLKNLDRLLDGGLYPGLYILGAMSSLGKTSLVLQIADRISENETDVLFFTAEQSIQELMAKSLSRIVGVMMSRGEVHDGISPRQILRGASRWTSEERKALELAVERYTIGSGHLWIIESDASRETDGRGSGDRIGIDTIRNAVSRHLDMTGRRPVVIIDYLQILQPSDQTGKKSDKQNTDELVSELRRLSVMERVPLLAISSLNRAAYYGPLGLDSFKESGSIEYSADVILALQPRGLRDKAGKAGKNSEADYVRIYENQERRPIRDMEIHVLKNRMGPRDAVPVSFDSRYGLFMDAVEDNKH